LKLESEDEFVVRELREVLLECLVLGMKSLELLESMRLDEALKAASVDSNPSPGKEKASANEKESTPFSFVEVKPYTGCLFSTGMSPLKVKLMSMHLSRSSSFKSWTWLCFSSGDSPLLRLSEGLSSISNLSDELELVTRAVRGRGTGWLTRIHEGSLGELGLEGPFE